MSLLLAAMLVQASMTPPSAPDRHSEHQSTEIAATSTQLLALASQAIADQQVVLAIEILTTLLQDPEMRVRNEARFRLAMLASRRKDWTEAGAYLRAILDEEPGAQRVRLELARVQAEMGDHDASRRTLRDAQAGELPSSVARLIERFSAALRRPAGRPSIVSPA